MTIEMCRTDQVATTAALAPGAGCLSWCMESGAYHDDEGYGGNLWHLLTVGAIPVTQNDLADEHASLDAPFEVAVSAYGGSEPKVCLTVQGWGETATFTAEQARHTAEVFARAAQLIEASAGGSR